MSCQPLSRRFQQCEAEVPRKTQKFRHSKNNEPPLSVQIGLMVHTRTGKRNLVDRLAAEGVSISYERVMNLRRSISNQGCMEHQANGLVYPVDLKKNVHILFRVCNLMMNQKTRSLMDVSNKIKRCKI